MQTGRQRGRPGARSPAPAETRPAAAVTRRPRARPPHHGLHLAARRRAAGPGPTVNGARSSGASAAAARDKVARDIPTRACTRAPPPPAQSAHPARSNAGAPGTCRGGARHPEAPHTAPTGGEQPPAASVLGREGHTRLPEKRDALATADAKHRGRDDALARETAEHTSPKDALASAGTAHTSLEDALATAGTEHTSLEVALATASTEHKSPEDALAVAGTESGGPSKPLRATTM